MIENYIETIIRASLIIYFISVLLYVIRLLRGPSIPDMVLAIDAITYSFITIFILLVLILNIPLLVTCAMVLSLFVYVLNIYIAKYLESHEMGE